MARKRIDPALIPKSPNLKFEKKLWKSEFSLIAGLDEAGRGCLAGPVAAGAVILEPTNNNLKLFKGVRDSKEMNVKNREYFSNEIKNLALTCAVGFASAKEIDNIGIVPATQMAMKRALNNLSKSPQHLLIDYISLPKVDLPATSLIKGDARSLSIACASVIAKVERDAYMVTMNAKYPDYQFSNNKGYGTASHRKALEELGPTPIHRHSFAPLRLFEEQDRLFSDT